MGSRGEYSEYIDEFGVAGPLPVSDGQRRHLDPDAPTGPEIGTRLPDFTLPSSTGRTVSFHEDRADGRAAVVFLRSVVW